MKSNKKSEAPFRCAPKPLPWPQAVAGSALVLAALALWVPQAAHAGGPSAMVAATSDPKLIVLGGSIGARPEFAKLVSDAVAQLSSRPIEIRPSALGNRAGVVGALSVALNKLHDDLFGIDNLPGTLPLPSLQSVLERGAA